MSLTKKEEKLLWIKSSDLVRSPKFDTTPLDELVKICNGCGSSKATFDYISDSIAGLDISPACYIHDFDYDEGGNEKKRKKDDKKFLKNINKLISKASWWLSAIRKALGLVYYTGVWWKGKDSYNYLNN